MDLWTSPSPFQDAITPSDTVDHSWSFRSIYVGTGGDVVVVSRNGGTATWANVPAGYIIPAIGRRVNATGTTASNLLALE